MKFHLFLLVLVLSWSCNRPCQSQLAANNDQISIPSPSTSSGSHTKGIREEAYNSVISSFEDRSGNLWFGTNRQGVYFYDGSGFTNFSKENGFCSNRVSAIIEDKEGHIWFGTDDGLCNWDGRSFNNIPIPQQDSSSSWLDSVYPIVNPNSISCLLQDEMGNMWLGTYGGGAYRYNCKDFTLFLSEKGRLQSDGLHHNVIQSILKDREGNIWFTSMTHGGVSRYDGDSFRHFTIEDGLSDDMVLSSFEDRAGNIWFGSLGNRQGGLDRYDGTSFTNFNASNGLCNNNVSCIYQDQTGRIWLGSMRGNLCSYDASASPNFAGFATAAGQGLFGILTILEDRAGNLWFGGRDSGLWRWDGKVLTDFGNMES